mmetsp:Transcript_28361/g.52224  ORF Transcript_28361/g.52224 Transcript_28361/m.52224 type:complete len:485 (-) Transcript_28361:332-1786(-)
MPPKFKLALQIEQETVANTTVHQSIRFNEDSLEVLSNSYNPISFNSKGMKKNDGSSYQISEKDIRIVKKLGQGASSTVHKGFCIPLNKFVAVKRINVFERETRQQMLNDIKALCDANDVPGLVKFHGAFHVPDSGQISIVLEYLDGGSLADVQAKVGRIEEKYLGKITAEILQGLLYLHREKHTVHRDIKPANILINLSGKAKISDFGISAFVNNTLAQCSTFKGTVTYMSPERINNERYSFPADIWSVGLSLIELATGIYPYDASGGPLQLMIHVLQEEIPLPKISDGFSPEFRDFIDRCMKKDPMQRGTAEQLISHPFITKYAPVTVHWPVFMQCVFDPIDKLEEIAFAFSFSYFALLNCVAAASNGSQSSEAVAKLGALYTDRSILNFEGEKTLGGRGVITERLTAAAAVHASFRVAYEVMDVACQPLGYDGTALVSIAGRLVSRMGGAPPEGFTAIFVLSQIQPGNYYVRNQMFRRTGNI